MKLLLLALCAAVAVARTSPIPDDEDAGPVDVIINGVPEGEPLEIGDIVDIKLKEHVDGEVVSATNVLFPYTAEGLALAAAESETPGAPEPVEPEVIPEPVALPESPAQEVIPEPVVLPEAAAPEVIPEPVVLPESPAPEVIPEPVELPEAAVPEVIPEPIILPEPVAPEVVPNPVILPPPSVPEVDEGSPDEEVMPVPEAQGPNGEIFNDGLVSVTVNTPEDPGVVATLQSWFNMVINYFNSAGVTVSHQII